MSDILKFYKEDPSDLLFSQHLEPTLRHWPWRRKASRSFKSIYNLANRTASSEVMQRFSRNLLDRLQQLSHGGVTAWSEMFASTVCESDGFTCSALRDEHVGKTAWNMRISEEESRELCTNVTIPRLNHAAKFSAEGPSVTLTRSSPTDA